MYCFSLRLTEDKTYKAAADRLLCALDNSSIEYRLLKNTHDIWMRDFMPVKTRSGNYVSFRYTPGYLRNFPNLRTDFQSEIAPQLPLLHFTDSHINLDGGNVVFSPSKKTAIISDRIFSENPELSRDVLLSELENLLEARIVVIPSLRTDLTGHADGMVRFLDERTVLGNRSSYRFGLETRTRSVLKKYGIETYDFPYFDSPGDSAVGCYLNFLETKHCVFLPVFGADADGEAVTAAEKLFSKTVVPVNIRDIAAAGGCLNCISWEL